MICASILYGIAIRPCIIMWKLLLFNSMLCIYYVLHQCKGVCRLVVYVINLQCTSVVDVYILCKESGALRGRIRKGGGRAWESKGLL